MLPEALVLIKKNSIFIIINTLILCIVIVLFPFSIDYTIYQELNDSKCTVYSDQGDAAKVKVILKPISTFARKGSKNAHVWQMLTKSLLYGLQTYQ